MANKQSFQVVQIEPMIGEHFDQTEYEETARRIVAEGRNYQNFLPYMMGECAHADKCGSSMCPLDDRLTAKETEDAQYACRISAAEKDRQQSPVKASPNIVQPKIYAPRPCECGEPRRPRHKYCARCAARKVKERDREKKRRKRRE